MNLDVNTLFLVTIYVETILGLLLMFAWAQNTAITAVAWWGIAHLLRAASVTLFGWHEWLFRAWYITGALLGGAPLAQGAVYLHLPRRVANALSVALVAVVLIAASFVLAKLYSEIIPLQKRSGGGAIAIR